MVLGGGLASGEVFVEPSVLFVRVIYIISVILLGATVGYISFKTNLDFYLRMTLFSSFLVNVLLSKKYYG